jgi:acyl-CoA synthetase (AMP-forming)/AMP-acid ligase II
VNPYIDKTYGESLAMIAERYATREALVFHGRRWTFRDIKREVDQTAARLATLGFCNATKIAVWLPNRPEFLWYWLAAAQMGLVAVIINTRLTRDEFVYQLAQSDSQAAVVATRDAFRDFLGDLAEACPGIRCGQAGAVQGEALPKLRHVICIDSPGGGYPGVHDWSGPAPDGLPVPPPATDPQAPAMIAYSSGTTALPKGAMLNHCVFRKVHDGSERMGAREDDRLYLCVPLFGVLATFNGILSFWVRGAAVVLAERFETKQCIADMAAERCTALHVLPAMVDAIVEHPDFSRTDLSRLRIGIALTQDPRLIDIIANRIGISGIVTSYGLTETTGVATRTWWNEPLEMRKASQGAPLPGVEAKIVDAETGATLPAGVPGEIWLSGYCTMPGYYDKPAETQAAITPDGWLRTGDLGTMDTAGRVSFISRLRDGYKHKGFNVSTAEVEKTLCAHPAVAAAQVVGLPHRRFGEVGAAFVILRNAIEPETLLAFLRGHLASFKLPRHVFPIDRFPVTAGTEKVQKFRLRDIALERLQCTEKEDIQ